MKRSPIKRGKPMRRGNARAWNSTLNSVRPKQREKNRKRVPVRDAYKSAHPMCERCGDVMWDVHEPWTRARGGPIDDPRNMMSVCRTCHDYIHQHNEESERNGWLIPAALGRAWLDAGGREQDRKPAFSPLKALEFARERYGDDGIAEYVQGAIEMNGDAA